MRRIPLIRRGPISHLGLDAEAGFTLIEIMVTVIILAVISGPITASIIIYLNSVNAAISRMTTSAGRSQLEVYLPRDAMNATTVYGNSGSTINLPNTCFTKAGVSLQSPGAGPWGVLVFEWTAQNVSGSSGPISLTPQRYEVDYVLAVQNTPPAGHPNATAEWLWRYAFTASSTYTSGSPATGCSLKTATLVSRDLAFDTSTPTNVALGTVLAPPSDSNGSASLRLVDFAGNQYTVRGEARA